MVLPSLCVTRLCRWDINTISRRELVYRVFHLCTARFILRVIQTQHPARDYPLDPPLFRPPRPEPVRPMSSVSWFAIHFF